MKSWIIWSLTGLFVLASGCAMTPIRSDRAPKTTQIKRSKITLRKAFEPRRTEDPTEVSPDAIATPSGLRHMRLREGTGSTHPTPESRVTVNYIGWTDEGRVLDSSYMRGEPSVFTLTKVIKGWQEGVPLMVVGEKRRFWVPGDLAYADSPMSHVPKGTLTFDIELLAIE
jgi:FKBP-type peptidyl-prolyl cis-trans isomerase